MPDTETHHDEVSFDVNDLPTDVFELSAKGVTVDSLTADTGLSESRQDPPPGSQCRP
ncbi:thiomuracin/GE37468 family thiazolyl RiPP peptide [Halostreptopolyspora alba]|uniref:GE37468 family thiazolyl peptide n=1 Tax=Halostreptopolyspora alba TaxID=2487137 RepID=A0A3N0E4F0_9ACTN|nr:GE37468 family thiazolyl peptide [Nocardiopsaceae bacterium YIM 96095]